MWLASTRKKVSEVFTPRRHEVNKTMYVRRPELERALIRAIDGSQHVLLCGESGNGKSWLYKSVLEGGVGFVAANCANADRLGSLTQEIQSIAFPAGVAKKIGYSESKEAGVSALALGANLSHEKSYEYIQDEPLLAAFKQLNKISKGARTIVVLENLESIFDDERLMDELANIILLLDDPRYASLGIKLLLVGTPSGVLEYFGKTKNLESVANRLTELTKVEGLTLGQVEELLSKGFVKELQVALAEHQIETMARRVHHVTMGVAQRVHEYCEQLAYQLEDADWNYADSLHAEAEEAWLTSGMRQSYVVVEANLNSRDTSVARRNQVLYSIGKLRIHQFDSRDIERVIQKEFSHTVPETNMGIGSILTDLSRGGDALLVRNEKTGQYRVKDPRYTMCIRVVLYKDKSSGKVAKKKFRND